MQSFFKSCSAGAVHHLKVNATASQGGAQHPIHRFARMGAVALQSVVDEMRSRTDDLAPPVFVIVYDIARFRDLKKAEDDYGGYGADKTVNPPRCGPRSSRTAPPPESFRSSGATAIKRLSAGWAENCSTASRRASSLP